MTLPRDQISEDELQAYVDGLLSPPEKLKLAQLLSGLPEIEQQVELQVQIDKAVLRLFQPSEVEEHQLKAVVSTQSDKVRSGQVRVSQARRRRSVVLALLASVSAAIAWGVVVWRFSDHRVPEPFFEPRPLAVIYNEMVSNGFRPYYFCRDEERFAETFRKHQKTPLWLAKLPDGSRMLGLSYPGGLSRDTTAVLCEVDWKKVLVFVDQLSEDKPIASLRDHTTLNVIRGELDDLVIYEVTPLDQAVISKYLVVAEPPAKELAP